MISDAFSYDSSSIVVLDDGEVNEATCYEMSFTRRTEWLQHSESPRVPVSEGSRSRFVFERFYDDQSG